MSERERRLLIVGGWLRLLTPYEWSQVECHLVSADRAMRDDERAVLPSQTPREHRAGAEAGSRPESEHPGH